MSLDQKIAGSTGSDDDMKHGISSYYSRAKNLINKMLEGLAYRSYNGDPIVHEKVEEAKRCFKKDTYPLYVLASGLIITFTSYQLHNNHLALFVEAIGASLIGTAIGRVGINLYEGYRVLSNNKSKLEHRIGKFGLFKEYMMIKNRLSGLHYKDYSEQKQVVKAYDTALLEIMKRNEKDKEAEKKELMIAFSTLDKKLSYGLDEFMDCMGVSR